MGNRVSVTASRREAVRLGIGGVAALNASILSASAEANATKRGQTHVIRSGASTVSVGVLDPSRKPIVTIRSGDIVEYPSTWLHWGNQPKFGMGYAERDAIRQQYRAGPYSLVGPVAIEGAQPGDVIECRLLRLKTIGWGWNSAPTGVGALPDQFPEPYLRYIRFSADRRWAQFSDQVRIPIRPFQAVMAVQPAGNDTVSGILTGAHGGNLKVPEFTEGSSLFLPVQAPLGLIWTGDTHAAQGDGVVNQTAIETAAEVLRIQYVLRRGRPIEGPLGETATHWIAMGFAPTLDGAMNMSLDRLLNWLAPASGMSRADLYALASIAASFRVTQFANQKASNYASVPDRGVHGMMPKAIFAPAAANQISAALRGSQL